MNRGHLSRPVACTRGLLAALLVTALLAPALARAQVENICPVAGRGDPCNSELQCSRNPKAKICADQSCQIPCMDASGRAPHMCSLGETCTSTDTATGTVHYCKPAPFTVDLNQLDMCIRYFVEDVIPELSSTKQCSLQANLNALLDQDGDGQFDIFDVAGCIQAYFDLPTCDAASQTCTAGRTFCTADANCGAGLFCDQESHACQRECGFIGNRDPLSDAYLERPCYGSLKTCNYDRGRCEPVLLASLTCQVDRDCPEGGYCFLGQCAPTCSRALDCADASWFCTPAGHCAPVPPPASDGAQPFVPTDYVVQFAEKKVLLAESEDAHAIPLLIMNLKTKKEVFDRQEVVFGYRLEVSYSTKQSPRCMKPRDQWTSDDTEECKIDDWKHFIRLASPFGTIRATGKPSVGIELDRAAANRLTPGLYQATITAIYDNGGQDTATIALHKTTLSGDYSGKMSVYVDGPKNLLGTTNASFRLSIDTGANPVRWNDLLAANNISADSELTDITSGYPVGGVLHANESSIFVNPGAARRDQDDIPIIGLYSPSLRRLRVLAVVELAPDDCHSDAATCAAADATSLKVKNVFARRIRRVMQFVGPYDGTVRQWSGIYRETLTGLAPFAVTLDGGFILRQVRDDDSGLPLASGLNPAGAPLLATDKAVGYPSQEAMLAEVDASITRECKDYQVAAKFFATSEAFNAYLAQLDEPEKRAGRIFPDLVSFESKLGAAVDTVSKGEALTLYDFLRDEVFLCSEGTEKSSKGKTCIKDEMAKCGLALHRKAILKGYVDLASLLPSSATAPSPSDAAGVHELFCSTTSSPPGCTLPAFQNPTVTTLQEHNHFYAELANAMKYQAGSDLSEAFFTLYKLHGEPGINQSAALNQKLSKLLAAWARYDELRLDLFSPAVTGMLFTWPMESFKEHGRPLLDETHSLLKDRRDALAQIVDLKRRVFVNTTAQDFMFVKHLLHYEWLSEVLLLALQRQWEGDQFNYPGNAQAMLEQGDLILAKVNETRNPLGFHPGQIFFENSDLSKVNWGNYRDQIGTIETGLLGEVNRAIAGAVANLKKSLDGKAALTSQFLAAQQDFERTIDSLCGPTNSASGEVVCPAHSDKERQEKAACSGPDCVYQYACENDQCTSVVQRFNQATGDALKDVACRIDTPSFAVQTSAEPTAPLRSCVRGQMGALLQEKVQLELQRKQIYTKIGNLLRRIDAESQRIGDTQRDNDQLLGYLKKQDFELTTVQEGLITADAVYQDARDAADSANCIAVAGAAAGGNCIQAPAVLAARTTATEVKFAAIGQLEVLRERLLRAKEIQFTDVKQQQALRDQQMVRDNLVTEVDNLIAEYQTVTQQLFNLEVRTADTFYLAKEAAEHYRENNSNIIASLVGTNDASALRRNKLVQQADDKFLELLRLTYKMTMAFIHSYNLESQARALTSQVFQITTPEGVQEFIAKLDQYERDYCGASGIDCDSVNNTAHFRFSFREELFPDLRDVVDARTGAVLTRGQQFHNLITSSMFRHQRYRGGLPVDQIELPFSIWLNDRGAQSGAVRQWMLSPLECNHVIVGRGNGTLAVNVRGANLTHPLTYELWRGNTDFLRGCEPEQVTPAGGGTPRTEYTIKPYIVGYAPQSALAKQEDPPSFVTHSSGMPACKGATENSQGHIDQESCYQYFARDRSLAAPDWSLVIPINGGANNTWLLGEGLPDSDRPMIEDIILYVRYRRRPIQ